MSKIIYNFAKVFTKKQSFKDLNVRDTGLKRGFLYSNFCKILNKSGGRLKFSLVGNPPTQPWNVEAIAESGPSPFRPGNNGPSGVFCALNRFSQGRP